MKKERKLLVYIPAKKNSERLPNKNSLKIGGKKLYEWTLDFALQIRKKVDYKTLIVFHSSLPLKQCYKDKYVVQIKRNEKKEKKEKTIARLFKKMLWDSGLNEEYGSEDLFLILQPTTPFRSLQDVENLFFILEKNKYVVSVKEIKNPCMFLDGENKLFFGKRQMLQETGSYFAGWFEVLPMLDSFSGSMLAYPYKEKVFMQDIDIEREYLQLKLYYEYLKKRGDENQFVKN